LLISVSVNLRAAAVPDISIVTFLGTKVFVLAKRAKSQRQTETGNRKRAETLSSLLWYWSVN